MHTRSGNPGVTHGGLPARRVWGTPACESRKLSQNFCVVLRVYVSGPPSPGPSVSQSVVLTCSAHFSLDTAPGPSTSFHKKATRTKHPKPFGRDSVVIRVHTGKCATWHHSPPLGPSLRLPFQVYSVFSCLRLSQETAVLCFLTTWNNSALSRSHPKLRCPNPPRGSAEPKNSK